VITEACDWLKPHFGSLVGCNFGPQVVPFCTISDWWCIDIGCKHREQASWHTMYWIFVGAGLYKMAMAIDQWPVLGRTRIATISFLIVVVHYAVWRRQVSCCASRDGDGATFIPYLYRKAVGAYSGMMWIFKDFCCHQKSRCSDYMTPWYHEGPCRVALYRGAIGGGGQPFRIAHMAKIFNLYIMYAFDIVLIFMPLKWCRWCWRE